MKKTGVRHKKGNKVVGKPNDGKFVIAGETIVSAARGGNCEETKTQLLSVIVGVRPNSKKPNSELTV